MSLFDTVLKAIGSATFGGGTKVTTNQQQSTQVGVEVNPQIGIVVEPNIANNIDLRPVAEAVAFAAAQGNLGLAAVGNAVLQGGIASAQGAMVQAAATRDAATITGALQGASLRDAADKIGSIVSENLPAVLLVIGGGFLLMRVTR